MTEALPMVLVVLVLLAVAMIVLQIVALLRSRQGLAQESLDRLARRSDEIAERLERDRLRVDLERDERAHRVRASAASTARR